MKCLTDDESKQWFARKGIQLDSSGNLLRPVGNSDLMTTVPKNANSLSFFSSRLSEWFSPNFSGIMWLADWQTFPCQMIPFLKMWPLHGEAKSLAEAPGCVFENSTEEETAAMAGLIFLALSYQWSVYIVADDADRYIYLGDEYIIFSSKEEETLKEATSLTHDYQLKVIQSNREAWV